MGFIGYLYAYTPKRKERKGKKNTSRREQKGKENRRKKHKINSA